MFLPPSMSVIVTPRHKVGEITLLGVGCILGAGLRRRAGQGERAE